MYVSEYTQYKIKIAIGKTLLYWAVQHTCIVVADLNNILYIYTNVHCVAYCKHIDVNGQK